MAFEKLSKAEQGVYSHIMQGLTNTEIGKRLFVSEKTVKFHLGNIYKKFNVASARELMAKPAQREMRKKEEKKPKGGLCMGQGQNNLATRVDVTSEALDKIDKKFKVGEVMNHLHSMMKGVTDKEMTPDTVMAACQCVSKMNEVMNTSIGAARFLRDNG